MPKIFHAFKNGLVLCMDMQGKKYGALRRMKSYLVSLRWKKICLLLHPMMAI